jgi:hypothetical protein
MMMYFKGNTMIAIMNEQANIESFRESFQFLLSKKKSAEDKLELTRGHLMSLHQLKIGQLNILTPDQQAIESYLNNQLLSYYK